MLGAVSGRQGPCLGDLTDLGGGQNFSITLRDREGGAWIRLRGQTSDVQNEGEFPVHWSHPGGVVLRSGCPSVAGPEGRSTMNPERDGPGGKGHHEPRKRWIFQRICDPEAGVTQEDRRGLWTVPPTREFIAIAT